MTSSDPAAAGETNPQVEVVPVRGDAPVYQSAARTAGRPLWTAAAPKKEISVARVFDTVEPTSGPRFAPDRPRLTDEAERARIVAYLKAGTGLLMTMGTDEDILDPGRGAVVPMSIRTDGSWIWSDMVAYYLEEHQVAPDPGLLRHIQRADGPPAPVDTVTLRHAMAVVTGPSPGASGRSVTESPRR